MKRKILTTAMTRRAAMTQAASMRRAAMMLLMMLLTTATAWAEEVTAVYSLTFNTTTQKTILTRSGGSGSVTWDYISGTNSTPWNAGATHGVDDEYDITFKPNKYLTLVGYEIRTSAETKFTVTVGAAGYYIKSASIGGANATAGQNAKTVDVTVPSNTNIQVLSVTLIKYYTVTPASGLQVTSGTSATSGGTTYYKPGTIVTVAPTNQYHIVEGTGGTGSASVSVASDKRSFSFTMPDQNVSPTATLTEVYQVTPASGITLSPAAYFTYGGAQYYKPNTTITLSSNVPTGYHAIYKASYNNGNKTLDGNTYTVNSTDRDVTLTAEYTINTYTITYHLNDGTLDTNKNSYTIESPDITLDTPTRTGFVFGGWYDNSGLTGEAVKTIAHGSTGNKEYWAKWLLPYIDADGQQKEAVNPTVLTGSESTSDTNLSGGWYVVTGNVSYSGKLRCGDNMYLVLCDGASLTINSSSYAIFAKNLTIYGQTQGTGTLTASSTGNYSIEASQNITINGGNVTATTSNIVGIYAENGNVTINGGNVSATRSYSIGISAPWGKITINGGSVEASGVYGICAGPAITLGWTNASDYIYASSYKVNGTVKIADGQSLYNGSEVLSGYISDMDKVNGKTLIPYIESTTADGTAILYDNDAGLPDGYLNADRLTTIADNHPHDIMLLGRTLTKNGEWNTLCLPFSMTAEQIAASPLAGATIKTMDNSDSGTSLDDRTLTLKFTTATSITASTPYIIKWGTTGSNIENPVFEGVTISSTAPEPVTSYDGKVTFVGQYSPFEIVESGATGDGQGNLNEILMLGSGSTLGYSQNPRTLRSFRAHFEIPTNGGVREFVLNFGDEETTGIISPAEIKEITDCNATLSKREMAGAWYSIDGRKLDTKPTAKGVYIRGGKKVIIK